MNLRRLQQTAIAISILSVVYNGAEGAVSVVLGSESDSNSLIFFGIQSLVEVLSAAFVVWRFAKITPPGAEANTALTPSALKKERVVTIGIGTLFIILTLSTWITSIVSLVKRSEPNSSTPSLVVSATALGIMIIIWAPKPYLAKQLNSSAMKGEAACSLACIQITVVLLAGTLIYRFWKNGWWVDSAVSIILGFLFAKQGIEMIRWGSNKNFSGGCCSDCAPQGNQDVEQGFNDEKCACCTEKLECNEQGYCVCDDNASCCSSNISRASTIIGTQDTSKTCCKWSNRNRKDVESTSDCDNSNSQSGCCKSTANQQKSCSKSTKSCNQACNDSVKQEDGCNTKQGFGNCSDMKFVLPEQPLNL